MDDLIFSRHKLSDLGHRITELVKITGGRDAREYRDHLYRMMKMGMSVWIAEHLGRIVGTIGFMIEPGQTGFTLNQKFVAAARAKGIEPFEVQVRSLIYTDPNYRGRGISYQLEKRTDEISTLLGFRYVAAFAYDSEDVCKWLHRRKNAIDLAIGDPGDTGLPVSMIPFGAP